MDPLTLALLGIGANIAGSIIKGSAEQRAAEANARIDEQNAQYADLAAADAIARGDVTEGRVKMAGSQVASKQKAGFASSGVDVQSGSAVDVQASTAGLTALDALIARSNAAREAWGYKVQGQQYRQRAQITRQAGRAQAQGAILGGIIGGARGALPFLRVAGQGEDPVDWASQSPLGGAEYT